MSLADLEHSRLFVRAYWMRNLYLLLSLSLTLVVLAFLACIRLHTHPTEQPGEESVLGFWITFEPFSFGSLWRFGLFLLLQLGVGHFALYSALKSKDMIQLYPEDKSAGQTFGAVTGPELVAMVQELAQQLGVRSVAQISVAPQPDPNAFTAWVVGVGNVVVLHSNLLEILPRDGVRTVIAHEVGHIRRGDSLLYQILSLPRNVAWILAALICVKVVGGLFEFDSFGQFFARLGFLCMAFWGIGQVFGLLGSLANLASQQTELLVDAYAAKLGGWQNHVNALLIMGDRADALQGFMMAMQKVVHRANEELTPKKALRLLKRLPARELDHQQAAEAAPMLYLIDKLTLLRQRLHVPLSDEQILDLATRAAHDLNRVDLDEKVQDEFSEDEAEETNEEQKSKESLEQNQAREKLEAAVRQNLLLWREYDSDRSGHIDAGEILPLIESLRKNPNRMIGRQYLEPEAQWQDHPTFRNRILFVYDLFAPDHRIEEKKASD